MPRLSYLKEYKAVIKAGVTAAANSTLTTNWEVGIPIDSAKQMDKAQYTRVGNVVTVWGSMVTKFDNTTPSFDVTAPITNGNAFTSISGTLKKQRSTEQLTVQVAIFGAGARVGTHVGITGSGISNTANETWDLKFTYTLT